MTPRLMMAGDLDTTFGDYGQVLMNLSTFEIRDLIVFDDKVWVVQNAFVSRHNLDGSFDLSFGTDGVHPAFIRLATDGVLDAAFGENGVVATPEVIDGYLEDFLVQADGKIVGLASYLPPTLFRMNPNGALDSGFSVAGIVPLNTFVGDGQLLQQPGGAIVVAEYRSGAASMLSGRCLVGLAKFVVQNDLEHRHALSQHAPFRECAMA